MFDEIQNIAGGSEYSVFWLLKQLTNLLPWLKSSLHFLQLVTWEEGGYKTSDKPMPRGEVVVGGASVSAGYFNSEAKTAEVYKVKARTTLLYNTSVHPFPCISVFLIFCFITDTG